MGINTIQYNMKRFTIVKIPTDATNIYINNVGCIRYSHNNERESSVVEPIEMGVYLDKEKHKIVGESFIGEDRYLVVEME